MDNQLSMLYGTDNKENRNKEMTENFDQHLSNELCNRKWQKINKNQYIKSEPCTISEYSAHNYILIETIQHHSYLLMTANLKIKSNHFDRKRNYFKQNCFFNQNEQNSYQFYSVGDDNYMRFKQICWGFVENLNVKKYIQQLEEELNRFKNNINFQYLVDFSLEEEKNNKYQTWLKDLLSKTSFQYPMNIKTFNTLDSKQISYQFFQLINVLDEKNNYIIFQSQNSNKLKKKQQVKKTVFQLTQNKVHSLIQLQQQINGFLILLTDQQQKMLKKALIRILFDVRKNICYQSDQELVNLNNKISSQEFNSHTLKQLKKLLESVTIIYYLQEHLILNEDYFNERVFQVDKKCRLKINFINSNELFTQKKNILNLNYQQGTQNRIEYLIKLIGLIVEINQVKQLSEEERENLDKLKQIVQYNIQTGLLQIPQILCVLDQIKFTSKKKDK